MVCGTRTGAPPPSRRGRIDRCMSQGASRKTRLTIPTASQWGQMLAAFRTAPDPKAAIKEIAEATGLSPNTVLIAYAHGWPEQNAPEPLCVAIRDVIDDERRLARLQVAAGAAVTAEGAPPDAAAFEAIQQAASIDAAKVEMHGLKVARSNAVSVLSMTANLLPKLTVLADRLASKIEKLEDDEISLHEGSLLLERGAKLAKAGVETLRAAIEAQRIYDREPGALAGNEPAIALESAEALREQLERFAAAVARESSRVGAPMGPVAGGAVTEDGALVEEVSRN